MSSIKVDSITDAAGTGAPAFPNGITGDGSALTGLASPVKAWVNFNGTGTVAIRDSFNVSSITDNGTGAYVVNFATNMVDINYAVQASVQTNQVSGAHFVNIHNGSGTSFPSRAPTVSSYALSVTNRTNYVRDSTYISSTVFGS